VQTLQKEQFSAIVVVAIFVHSFGEQESLKPIEVTIVINKIKNVINRIISLIISMIRTRAIEKKYIIFWIL
jgi:hypothetical protein